MLNTSGNNHGNDDELNFWANFRRYWKEQLAHAHTGYVAIVGAVAIAFLLSFIIYPIAASIIGAGAGISLLHICLKRQELEFYKRSDTPGIDLAWVLAGAIAGFYTVVIVLAILLFLL